MWGRYPDTLCWKCELVQPERTVQRFLRNGNMHLPHDPAIALPGVYPKEVKSAFESYLYSLMFITTQPTIAKI